MSVMFYIQHDSNLFPKFLAGYQVHDELERLQSLASPANQEPGVLPGKVNNGSPHFLVMGGSQGANYVYFGTREYLIESIHGCRGDVSPFRYLGHSDPGQLCTNAQEPGLAST